ncbi:winged helix-turn-helix transcriptional regulator [Alkalispirochaeta alkalica]|uniref:winged helix-turn-helix transcriptional regulator n=1 Tax=Alkalispirochaeta alkalica TaxID=46356 RepID=UPI00037388C6|nr:winged helix-turn-helix transcriptional regulator [Alkalispirochaeta alkalica]
MNISATETQDTPDLRELDLLAHIHQGSRLDQGHSQRTLASALGLSLGMTNVILKRLVARGFVLVRRTGGHRAQYLLTPRGMEQLGKRSYRYLRRTVGHVVRYKELIRQELRRHRQAGGHRVVLVGASDLEFILEWCASKEGLHLETRPAPEGAADPGISDADTLVLWSEKVPTPRGKTLTDLLEPPASPQAATRQNERT